jgi:hypothetical protein
MNEITLEKIDVIRQRWGVSYSEAKSVLEINNGNLVDSLIYLEKNHKSFSQNVNEMGNELTETVKKIVSKGNVNRIKIKKDDKTLIDIPVTAGIAAGALGLFYPSLMAIGAVTAIASKVTLEVERPDGQVDIVNDVVKEKFQSVKDKVSCVVDTSTSKIGDIKDQMLDKVENFNNNSQNNTLG